MALSHGICRLCGTSGPLLKKSHIIPDFLFRATDVYDEGHRLLIVHPAEYARGLGRVRRPPTAPYDPDILCQRCDGVVLGDYDSYASRLLFEAPPALIPKPSAVYYKLQEGFGELHITDFDSAKLKLFLLSVLWRAHVSKHDYFTEVDLGQYEAEIRAIIFEGRHLHEDDYPMFFLGWREETFPRSVVSRLARGRWKGISTHYLLMFGGLIVQMFVPRVQGSFELSRFKLKAAGPLVIGQLNYEAFGMYFRNLYPAG